MKSCPCHTAHVSQQLKLAGHDSHAHCTLVLMSVVTQLCMLAGHGIHALCILVFCMSVGMVHEVCAHVLATQLFMLAGHDIHAHCKVGFMSVGMYVVIMGWAWC